MMGNWYGLMWQCPINRGSYLKDRKHSEIFISGSNNPMTDMLFFLRKKMHIATEVPIEMKKNIVNSDSQFAKSLFLFQRIQNHALHMVSTVISKFVSATLDWTQIEQTLIWHCHVQNTIMEPYTKKYERNWLEMALVPVKGQLETSFANTRA